MNKFIFAVLLTVLNSALLSAQDFDLDSFKEIRTHLVNDSDQTKGIINWRNREVSFAYEYKPVSEILSEIFSVTEVSKPIVGLQLLKNRKPSKVAMIKVKAIKAVSTLLRCEGFRLKENADNFVIQPDASIKRESCLYG